MTVLAANIPSVATASHLSSKPRATLKSGLKEMVKSEEVVKQFHLEPSLLRLFGPLGWAPYVRPVFDAAGRCSAFRKQEGRRSS